MNLVGLHNYSAVGYLSAVTFLEYWKRKTAELGHRWDCLDFQDEEVGL